MRRNPNLPLIHQPFGEEQENGQQVPYEPLGIDAPAVQSYYSAILQCLAAIPSLTEIFAANKEEMYEGSMTRVLRSFFSEMKSGEIGDMVNSYPFIDVLARRDSYYGRKENVDAADALRTILEVLLEEANIPSDIDEFKLEDPRFTRFGIIAPQWQKPVVLTEQQRQHFWSAGELTMAKNLLPPETVHEYSLDDMLTSPENSPETLDTTGFSCEPEKISLGGFSDFGSKPMRNWESQLNTEAISFVSRGSASLKNPDNKEAFSTNTPPFSEIVSRAEEPSPKSSVSNRIDSPSLLARSNQSRGLGSSKEIRNPNEPKVTRLDPKSSNKGLTSISSDENDPDFELDFSEEDEEQVFWEKYRGEQKEYMPQTGREQKDGFISSTHERAIKKFKLDQFEDRRKAILEHLPLYKPQPDICFTEQYQRIMMGSTVLAVMCDTCGTRYPTSYLPHFVLPLPIVKNPDGTVGPLEQSLQMKFTSQEFDGGSQLWCEVCIKWQRLRRHVGNVRMEMQHAPRVLCFQLERFHMNSNGEYIKDSSRVSFPLQLDISDYVAPDLEQHDLSYRLIALIKHSGAQKTHNSFYEAFVRGDTLENGPEWAREEKWFMCTGKHVREVSKERLVEEQAYILIYERTNLSWNDHIPEREPRRMISLFARALEVRREELHEKMDIAKD